MESETTAVLWSCYYFKVCYQTFSYGISGPREGRDFRFLFCFPLEMTLQSPILNCFHHHLNVCSERIVVYFYSRSRKLIFSMQAESGKWRHNALYLEILVLMHSNVNHFSLFAFAIPVYTTHPTIQMVLVVVISNSCLLGLNKYLQIMQIICIMNIINGCTGFNGQGQLPIKPGVKENNQISCYFTARTVRRIHSTWIF